MHDDEMNSSFQSVINKKLIEMILNEAGKMAQKEWNDRTIKCPGTVIDKFIVMPSHIRGIIFIVGAPLVGALPLASPDDTNRMHPAKDRAGTRPDNIHITFNGDL